MWLRTVLNNQVYYQLLQILLSEQVPEHSSLNSKQILIVVGDTLLCPGERNNSVISESLLTCSLKLSDKCSTNKLMAQNLNIGRQTHVSCPPSQKGGISCDFYLWEMKNMDHTDIFWT